MDRIRDERHIGLMIGLMLLVIIATLAAFVYDTRAAESDPVEISVQGICIDGENHLVWEVTSDQPTGITAFPSGGGEGMTLDIDIWKGTQPLVLGLAGVDDSITVYPQNRPEEAVTAPAPTGPDCTAYYGDVIDEPIPPDDPGDTGNVGEPPASEAPDQTGKVGTATYCAPTPRYCGGWGGNAHLGAVESFKYGDRPYNVDVCLLDDLSRCTTVKVVSYCDCGSTLIDLSPAAFRDLAPLYKGRIKVSVDRAISVAHLPPTDTE